MPSLPALVVAFVGAYTTTSEQLPPLASVAPHVPPVPGYVPPLNLNGRASVPASDSAVAATAPLLLRKNVCSAVVPTEIEPNVYGPQDSPQPPPLPSLMETSAARVAVPMTSRNAAGWATDAALV